MIPLFTLEEYNRAKSRQLLALQCEQCGAKFNKIKKAIRHVMLKLHGQENKLKFCSHKCGGLAISKIQQVDCLQCNIIFGKQLCQCEKHPNHFCSSSCAAIYNNNKRPFGLKRSKNELLAQNHIETNYKDLNVIYNSRTILENSEIDIYIPELKLAIEINGMHHYRPIFGEELFNKTIKKDKILMNKCKKANINLEIISCLEHKTSVTKKDNQYIRSSIDNILSKYTKN